MKKNYLLIMIVFGLCSCKKEPPVNPVSSLIDVYVAGYVSDTNRVPMPTYWKNGSPVQLEIPNSTLTAWTTTSIAVSGNDVYVAGWGILSSSNTYSQVGMFWKNGILVDLLNNSSALTSLVVLNNDVYLAGYDYNAEYWKNGNMVYLTNGSPSSRASSIAVSGNDVYVAGTSYLAGTSFNGDGNAIAKYWRNGSSVNLTDGSTYAAALSIIVSVNDVYVAGYEGNIATYWKNGRPVNLTDSSTIAIASSIAVIGTDVYVAGLQDVKYNYAGPVGIATYWKNGKPVNLTDGSTDATASSIAVTGNDVYVAGTSINTSGNGIAKYWKNGSPVNLTDGSTDAGSNAIFLSIH